MQSITSSLLLLMIARSKAYSVSPDHSRQVVSGPMHGEHHEQMAWKVAAHLAWTATA